MRIVDDLTGDPATFVPEREELDFSGAGLAVVDADWGESAIEATMIRRALGEEPVGRRPLNKDSVLKLAVRDEGEVDFSAAGHLLQQQVSTWQRRGGWLQRDFIFGNFAGSVACQVKKAALSNFAGWQEGTSPDVTLSMLTGPAWYSVEEIESDLFVETLNRELIFTLSELLGSAPGLIRVRVTNDGENAWRGLYGALECEDHPQDATADTTAALAYECEDLTPLGGAEVKTMAGASNGKVVECELSAGWVAVLDSEIAGVGHMTHRGPRRLKFRVNDPGSTAGEVQLRLQSRSLGSLQWTPGEIFTVPIAGDFAEIDMGECRPNSAILGEDRWQWQLTARAPGGFGVICLDRVRPLPTEQLLTVRAPAVEETATTQVTKSPGEVLDDSAVGAVEWKETSKAKTSDDAWAKAETFADDVTHYLKAMDFAFALPEDAVPLGILAAVERHADSKAQAKDERVRIIKGGVVKEAQDKAGPDVWPTSDAFHFYGDANDLWGQSWLPSDINDSEFGVAIAAKDWGPAGGTISIDSISISVYYKIEGDDENRVCFAERSIELRSDGVYRQHPTDDVWGRLVPEDGFYFTSPPAGLDQRTARVIIVPSQGDLDTLPDVGSNNLSARALYRPGYLFAREAAS
jgi:hypothetical protein